MNTANQSTLSAGLNELLDDPSQKGYFARRNAMDWLFAAVMSGAMVIAFSLYHGAMDGYEKGILLGITPAAIALGWFWRPLARLMLRLVLAVVPVVRAVAVVEGLATL